MALAGGEQVEAAAPLFGFFAAAGVFGLPLVDVEAGGEGDSEGADPRAAFLAVGVFGHEAVGGLEEDPLAVGGEVVGEGGGWSGWDELGEVDAAEAGGTARPFPARITRDAAESRAPRVVEVELRHSFVVVGGELSLGAEEQGLAVGGDAGGLFSLTSRLPRGSQLLASLLASSRAMKRVGCPSSAR